VRSKNNGNPSILKAVQEVQVGLNVLQSSVDSVETKVESISAIGAALTALQSALTTLQTSVDGLKSESNANVRVTPPVDVAPPDLASCGLVNVSTQSRTVKTEIVGIDGVVNEGPFTSTLLPGTGNAFGNRTANFFYCRFTVLDGVKADIRAGMSVCTNTACKQTVAAE
jgi:Nucleopolyhedrovirus P10 protein